MDNKTEPAAVLRNLTAAITSEGKYDGWRVVTIDRFYTSVVLLLQLLVMKVYAVGTVMTNRVGFCPAVVDKSSARACTGRRGQFKASRAVEVPSLAAVSWIDKKPVHFLAIGAALSALTVNRRSAQSLLAVQSPKVVADYHAMMGGVDRHDQLRLQSYSIQTGFRFRKYYKSLFVGLLDLAIVNSLSRARHARSVPALLRSHARTLCRSSSADDRSRADRLRERWRRSDADSSLARTTHHAHSRTQRRMARHRQRRQAPS